MSFDFYDSDDLSRFCFDQSQNWLKKFFWRFPQGNGLVLGFLGLCEFLFNLSLPTYLLSNGLAAHSPANWEFTVGNQAIPQDLLDVPWPVPSVLLSAGEISAWRGTCYAFAHYKVATIKVNSEVGRRQSRDHSASCWSALQSRGKPGWRSPTLSRIHFHPARSGWVWSRPQGKRWPGDGTKPPWLPRAVT